MVVQLSISSFPDAMSEPASHQRVMKPPLTSHFFRKPPGRPRSACRGSSRKFGWRSLSLMEKCNKYAPDARSPKIAQKHTYNCCEKSDACDQLHVSRDRVLDIRQTQ